TAPPPAPALSTAASPAAGPAAAATEQPKPGAERATPAGNHGAFAFGSYGRIIAATHRRGRPRRDANIASHRSRPDQTNYGELERRREDGWAKTSSTTRLVATLAIASPIFHYNADFNIKMAARNLYLEENGLGLKGLSAWAGSRMYRGDDIYLLDFWPLDN